jgi:hypothetical protein
MSRRILVVVVLAFFAMPAAHAAAVKTFSLALTVNGPGEVECEVEGVVELFCEPEYAENTAITLIPVPESGAEFSGWSGDCSGTGNCELTMDQNREATATFEEITPPEPEFTLTVVKAGSGLGTVTSTPTGIDCGPLCAVPFVEGTEVTLNAAPEPGSLFGGWSGAGCSGTEPCEVTMDEPHSVTATFIVDMPPPPPTKTTTVPSSIGGTAAVGATAKVKGGKALLKLTCKGEGACAGMLKLIARIKSGGKTRSLTIGRRSFSFGVGAATTLKVKLSGAAQRALAKGRHGMPLTAKVGGTGVSSSTVTLKPPKK